MPRFLHQWIFLAIWTIALPWAFLFPGGNGAITQELLERLVQSAFFLGPQSVDWSLIMLFNFMGLWPFVILFLLMAQEPARGRLGPKLVFFGAAMIGGAFAFYPYLFSQTTKAPDKSPSPEQREWAHSPWPAGVILVLFVILLIAGLWLGHPGILIQMIADLTLVRVMAVDFALFWIAGTVLAWRDLQAQKVVLAARIGLTALVGLPLAGPLIYLILKNFVFKSPPPPRSIA